MTLGIFLNADKQVAKWIANVRFTLKRSTEFRGRDSILLFEGFA